MKMYFTSISDEKHLGFLLDNKCCNILISFLEKNKILKLIEKHNPEINIFIDSGAFSAFTRDLKVDIDEYIKFINLVHSDVKLYAALDVIPTHSNPESVAKCSKESWDNYLYMRERVEDKYKLIPTFHYGEDYEYLKDILNYSDEYGKVEYLALGGLARRSSSERETFIETCYRIIKECERTDIKIHLFGVTDMDVCRKYGGTSTDSTSWVRAAAFGEICTEYGRLIVSDTRALHPRHISNNSPVVQQDIVDKLEQYGISMQELSESTRARELYNLMYFYNITKDISEPNYDLCSVAKVSLW